MAEGGSSDQEKTEDPTPQRREDFRKKGQVAQSKEIGNCAGAFCCDVDRLVSWALFS